MTRKDLRPGPTLKWSVWGGLGLLVLSGVILAYEPAEAWHLGASRLHGALAMLFLLVLGAMTAHVRSGLAARRNTVWGAALLAALAGVVVSAWGLYYAPEELHAMMVRAHLWSGLAIPVLVYLHAIKGKR